MNKALLVGRLGKNPEVRYNGDKAVAKFNLAVDRKFSNPKETDWLPCVCFGKLAEFAEKYLTKGTKVIVAGRIQTGSYTNKDNVRVYTTDIICDEIEFAESKSTGAGNAGPSSPESDGPSVPVSDPAPGIPSDFSSATDDVFSDGEEEELPFL